MFFLQLFNINLHLGLHNFRSLFYNRGRGEQNGRARKSNRTGDFKITEKQ